MLYICSILCTLSGLGSEVFFRKAEALGASSSESDMSSTEKLIKEYYYMHKCTIGTRYKQMGLTEKI